MPDLPGAVLNMVCEPTFRILVEPPKVKKAQEWMTNYIKTLESTDEADALSLYEWATLEDSPCESDDAISLCAWSNWCRTWIPETLMIEGVDQSTLWQKKIVPLGFALSLAQHAKPHFSEETDGPLDPGVVDHLHTKWLATYTALVR